MIVQTAHEHVAEFPDRKVQVPHVLKKFILVETGSDIEKFLTSRDVYNNMTLCDYNYIQIQIRTQHDGSLVNCTGDVIISIVYQYAVFETICILLFNTSPGHLGVEFEPYMSRDSTRV